MDISWRHMALFVLMAIVRDVVGVSLSLCSSLNTADGSATYAQFQTNGLCSNTCGSDYAFAITQGSNCWCSNYAPGVTVSTDSCNQECPGYPYEYCGSSGGLFGYVALNKSPAGTKGGSTSTTTTSQATTTAEPSTVVVTATPSTTSTSSSSTTTPSATSTNPSTETVTRSPVTSIVTLPGQTQVSTIIITPTAVSSADSSPLGQGASNNISSKGLSKGAVAGLAVGLALGISLFAGIIIFFLLRRMKQRRETNEAAISPEMSVGGVGGTPSSVSRHTSQMSQNGLLTKNPRISTRNLSNTGGGGSAGASAVSNASPTGNGNNRRSLGADQRLDPYHAIYMNEGLRHSDVSLQDNTDYSRKILSVRNRGDGEVEDE